MTTRLSRHWPELLASLVAITLAIAWAAAPVNHDAVAAQPDTVEIPAKSNSVRHVVQSAKMVFVPSRASIAVVRAKEASRIGAIIT